MSFFFLAMDKKIRAVAIVLSLGWINHFNIGEFSPSCAYIEP